MASRRRAWADKRLAGNSLVAGTDILLDLLSDAVVSDTLTVIRIVGDLTVQYVVDTTVSDGLSIVDVGIGVAASSGISASAFPEVTGTTEYPARGWLYVASQPVSQLVTTTTGIIDHPARFVFDLGAMRKIDRGLLMLRIANTNITVGGAMQVTGRVRVLCLT